MQEKSLTDIFNQFAGKEVPMAETSRTLNIGGKDYTFNEIAPANANDPTLEAMKKAANDKGLRLRVWWPGIMGTMDYDTRRVNAHIEKAQDGKWRVSNRFNLG